MIFWGEIVFVWCFDGFYEQLEVKWRLFWHFDPEERKITTVGRSGLFVQVRQMQNTPLLW